MIKKLILYLIAFSLFFSVLPEQNVEAKSKNGSLAFQMKEMASASYKKTSENTVRGWKFYKKASFVNSLQYKIFRKKKGKKYDYTIAVAGTSGFIDGFTDFNIIVNNHYVGQIKTLEKEVNSFIKKNKSKINKLYVTGHSLGGFLASYVVSDVVQGVRVKGISKSKVKAYTFNAPGFKKDYIKMVRLPNSFNIWKKKWVKEPISAKKLKNNKKKHFHKYIINYRIIGDVFSTYNTSLGKIEKVNSGKKKRNIKEYHQLKRFNINNI